MMMLTMEMAMMIIGADHANLVSPPSASTPARDTRPELCSRDSSRKLKPYTQEMNLAGRGDGLVQPAITKEQAGLGAPQQPANSGS